MDRTTRRVAILGFGIVGILIAAVALFFPRPVARDEAPKGGGRGDVGKAGDFNDLKAKADLELHSDTIFRFQTIFAYVRVTNIGDGVMTAYDNSYIFHDTANIKFEVTENGKQEPVYARTPRTVNVKVVGPNPEFIMDWDDYTWKKGQRLSAERKIVPVFIGKEGVLSYLNAGQYHIQASVWMQGNKQTYATNVSPLEIKEPPKEAGPILSELANWAFLFEQDYEWVVDMADEDREKFVGLFEALKTTWPDAPHLIDMEFKMLPFTLKKDATVDLALLERSCERFMQKYPKSPWTDEVLYKLALKEEHLGAHEKAYAHMKKLVSEQPNSPFKEDCEERLKNPDPDQ